MRIIRKYYSRIFYNKYYKTAKKSKTHSLLCKDVYGKDLCQHGMMNMQQLDYMLSQLEVDSSSSILDIGCGRGDISNYIYSKTNSRVSGIDFAGTAIRAAKKSFPGITFRKLDLDNWHKLKTRFDTVIAIDVLHFAKDISKTLLDILNIIKKDGKLAIFYTQRHTGDSFHPDNTIIAKILNEHNYTYTTHDFTKAERLHWEKMNDALQTLKNDFYAENMGELYEMRLKETRFNYSIRNNRSRFFYIVNKSH